MKLFRFTLLLSAIVFTTACTNHTVRQHQDYVEIAKNINSVVIVPPEVAIELITFDSDNESLKEEEALISAEIIDHAKTRLTEEGLEVFEYDFDLALVEDEEFAYNLTQCREAWQAAKQELYAKGITSKSKVSQFTTTLGPVANAIAERTGADAILFMHYQGAKKSGGMVAKDVGASILIGVLTAGAVVPIQATQSSTVDVALVESDSGKVIWSNRKGHTAVSKQVVEMAFKEMPDVQWQSELQHNSSSATESPNTSDDS